MRAGRKEQAAAALRDGAPAGGRRCSASRQTTAERIARFMWQLLLVDPVGRALTRPNHGFLPSVSERKVADHQPLSKRLLLSEEQISQSRLLRPPAAPA
jgi:hypothetical protein